MFPQQSVLEPSYLSITQVSAQDLLPQQNDTEPSDAWIKQDQHHDQDQFRVIKVVILIHIVEMIVSVRNLV